ncbi:hypothetical protein J4406_02620 [Candidatus Woesearchaeota archaeon]|nr:hypothetical protein [Candidatus Woesearchaeota archaeon]
MTNENQPNLEDMLLKIASLTNVSKGIGKSKTPQEQADLYELAAKMISGRDEEQYKRVIRELTRNPAYAVMETEGARDNLAGSVKEQYDAEKVRVIKDVESRINENLKEAKDSKAIASMVVAQYLNDILDVPEYTQEQVDDIESNQVYSMGLPYAFEARGSVEHYKNLELRKKASEYLKAIKEKDGDKEKVVRYVIDSEKLGKAMEDVTMGASVYGRTKAVTEAIKKAKEKKAKNK